MDDLFEKYTRYKECYYASIEHSYDIGTIDDEDYDNLYNNVMTYDDFIGEIVDREYDEMKV